MYVKNIIDNFKRQYGDSWLGRYFQWQHSNKGQASKAVVTAKRRGHKIIKSLAKTKAGKARARREKKK